MKSCLDCSSYIVCTDPKKNHAYSCKKFETKNRDFDIFSMDFGEEDHASPPSTVLTESFFSDFDVSKMLEEFLSSDMAVPVDLKVDDRDMWKAPNFASFALDKRGLEVKPYTKQLILATVLFSEWCPYCSDNDWLHNRAKVDDPLSEFMDRVVLLENGVCPKCQEKRSDMLLTKDLPSYEELAAVIGQRGGKCISSNSVIPTENGFLEIGEICGEDRHYGFSEFEMQVLVGDTGKLAKATKFYRERQENLVSIRLKNGFVLSGTKNHPILTNKDFVVLGDISTGHYVPVYYGQEIWGDSIPNFTDIPIDNLSKHYPEGEISEEIAKAIGFLMTGKTRTLFQGVMGLDPRVTSKETSIPKCIRMAPANLVLAFLQGLFDGDGGIDDEEGITYTSLSRRLIDQVSSILNNIGIHHKIVVKKTWATNDADKQVVKDGYVIHIRGFEPLNTFKNRIGFSDDRKRDSLDRVLNKQAKIDMPMWYDKCPDWMKDDFLEFIDYLKSQLNLFNQRIGAEGWSKLKRLRASNVALTKKKLLYYCEPLLQEFRELLTEQQILKAEYFVRYARGNMYYSPVVSVYIDDEPRESFDFTVPGYHRFMSNGIVSHNSALVVMLAAYLQHRMLKLQRPNEVYGVLRQNIFTGTFVAVTQQQAVTNLWEPFHNLIGDSSWYKEYHALLTYYGEKYGEELFKFKDTFIAYRHRSIAVRAKGPDKRKLRGETRFFYALDELGWFDNNRDSTKITLNGTEIHKALSNSLRTIRSECKRLVEQGYNDIPSGYALNISSPSSARDKIIELYNASKASTNIYGVKMPTWEFNPKVTREDLEDEFRTNPIEAERDYGANPPLTDSPFIGSFAIVEPCFRNGRNSLKMKYARKKMRDGSLSRFAIIDSVRNINHNTVLALDAGHTNNSFAFAVGHLENDVPRIDVVGEIPPLVGIPVNYSRVFDEVLIPLVETLNVQVMATDRWQNIKILHDIENSHGIHTKQYSLKYNDMWMFRQLLLDGEVLLPRTTQKIEEALQYDYDRYPFCFQDDPMSHLMVQMITVKDTGNQVIKGDNMTDDILRAVMLAVTVMGMEEYQQILMEVRERPRASLGVSGSRFGGAIGMAQGASIGGLGSARSRFR